MVLWTMVANTLFANGNFLFLKNHINISLLHCLFYWKKHKRLYT